MIGMFRNFVHEIKKRIYKNKYLYVYKTSYLDPNFLITLRIDKNDPHVTTDLLREVVDSNYARYVTNKAYVEDIVHKKYNTSYDELDRPYGGRIIYKKGHTISTQMEIKDYYYRNISFFLNKKVAFFDESYVPSNFIGNINYYGTDGQLTHNISYKNGVKDGWSQWWHDRSTLSQISNYTNGYLNGNAYRFSITGSHLSQDKFKNCIEYEYYPNGKVHKELHFKDNKIIDFKHYNQYGNKIDYAPHEYKAKKDEENLFYCGKS